MSFRPFALSLVLMCVATQAAAQSRPVPVPTQVDPLARMNEAVDALTRKVWPSVVQILVSGYAPQPDDSHAGAASAVMTPQQSTGSGFVIDAEGYIMTNAHVVSGASRIQVVIPAADVDGTLAKALSPRPRIVPAKIVGITTELDLAVLKVDQQLKPLPLATYSELRQGETVFAFGSPIGLRNTLTHGLVSAVARQVTPDSERIFVQTDAPINPGNSGGPLVNIRGEVVGVNTFIVSQAGGSEGLGFAIPSATARTVFRQFKTYGYLRRQEIGINVQTITVPMARALGLAREFGVIVSDVAPGGPAAKAGVMPGDVLVSVDGQPADNLPTVMYNFRLRDAPGPMQLVVMRGEAQLSVAVTPVEERDQLSAVALTADPTKNLVRELGILGVEVTPEIAASAQGLRDPYGVIVVGRAATPGAAAPLQTYDIIRSINNRRVATLASLQESAAALRPGTAVTLQVQRDGRLMYVSFTIE
jgi:serine protease Do